MAECNTCKKKKCSCKTNNFTRSVIEINNPEQLVLLRKVIVPANMGDETDVPASIGKYRNVVLRYEANKHTYIYSSDGIPTLLELEVPQEVLDRISTLEDGLEKEISDRIEGDNSLSNRIVGVANDLADEVLNRQNADASLQREIDDLKNNPDVVDIVATYADLEAYDTQQLTDNDIIRVLRDETHGGESSFYRWNAGTSTWTFISTIGDYYTRQQTDALLDAKQDNLTPGDNIQIHTEGDSLVISATDTTYSAGEGLNLTNTTFSVDTNVIATQTDLDTKQDKLTAGNAINITNNVINADIYPSDYFTDVATTGDCGKNINLGDTTPAFIDSAQIEGDTTQQTYTGKNLLDTASMRGKSSRGMETTVNSDGSFTISGVATDNWADFTENSSITLEGGKTYTLSISEALPFSITAYLNSPRQTIDIAAGSTSGTATIDSDKTSIHFYGYGLSAGQRYDVTVRNIQLEESQTATSYEPYVGGVASPNPNYPQVVNVVTGEQTITISGDGGSQTYPVGLGSIELCKIGGYQDYIYKNGGDWFIHKETNKLVFDASQDESWGLSSNSRFYCNANLYKGGVLPANDQTNVGMFCNNLTPRTYQEAWTNETNYSITARYDNNANPRIINKDCSTLAEFTTWLSQNPVSLYYPLSVATEARITDTELLTQLNVLAKAKSYSDNTNITVSASSPSLPAELCVSAYKNSAAGIAEAVSAASIAYTAGNAIEISGDNVISAMVYPEDFFLAGATKEMEGDIFEMAGTANLHAKEIDIRGNTYQHEYRGVNLLKAPFNLRKDNWQFGAGQSWLNVITTGSEVDPPDGSLQRLFIYERNNSDYDIVMSAGRYVLAANLVNSTQTKWRIPRLVIKSGAQEYYTTPSDRYIIDIPSNITVDSFYCEIPAGYTDIVASSIQPCIIPESSFNGFEPYTSLLPAPSPLAPQRFFTATGDQVIRAANSNLYNYQDVSYVGPTVSADSDGWITFNIAHNAQYANYFSHNLSLKEDTEYSLVVEVKSVTNRENISGIALADGGHIDSQIARGATITRADLIPGTVKVYKIKTKSDFSNATIGLRTYAMKEYDAQDTSVTIRISVVSDLDITPSRFRYQKYLGQESVVNLGVNLFDKNNATYNLDQSFVPGQAIQSSPDGRSMVLYMPCDVGTEYWVSDQSSVSLDKRTVGITEALPNVGVSVWSHLGTNGLGSKEISVPVGSKAKYMVIYYHAESGDTISNRLSDILSTLQIERTQRQMGQYSAYFTPIELHKIGDSQDRIYRSGLTDWVLHKETEKIVYNGTEASWSIDAANHTASIAHGGGILTDDYLCTHFRADSTLSENNTFSVSNTHVTFRADDIITSLQSWTDWLTLNNVSVVVGINTPVETPLTNSQVVDGLVHMRNIICYPDFTIFSSDGSESANAHLRVEAYLNSLQGLTAAIRDIPICC